MSTKKASSPLEMLGQKLGERPQGTRCALVVEPDHLVEWVRTLTDRKGRDWSVVIYRGDDIVTRRAWHRTWGKERPVCLVLTRVEGNQSRLDASNIADLVSRS